ncbi:HsdM family class I SAM-dependent methyltransferase [Sphingomonas sp. PB4P5]|uniref:HsdM family class I SAM-dependent methyltransferase n=1 Tax=Parasphingomonas puruogangriensis TaxID=3096155 RepID=UPI002FCAD2F9
MTEADLNLGPAARLAAFLAALRAERSTLLGCGGEALTVCMMFADGDIDRRQSSAADHLAYLDTDLRDYAISSAYALLIGNERRKALSAYFTPPALAEAALEAARQFLDRPNPLVLDPACGGGSFLVPTARAMIRQLIADNVDVAEACVSAIERLRGIELEPGLARLSARLLADSVRREFQVDVDTAAVVKAADALTAQLDTRFDLVIGNPPYSKVWRDGADRVGEDVGRADLGGHTNLYALFLLRSLDWLAPGGGLVFVLPTSFIAGPYYVGLREEILDRANVVRIDMHQQRENLFIDAIQDVCLLVLQRHGGAIEPDNTYTVGLIDADGNREVLGTATTPPNGESWIIPGVGAPCSDAGHFNLTTTHAASVIASYGYKVRVGKVVPKRERASLFKDPAAGRLPVLWASDIRPDGGFQFQGGSRTAASAWYAPPYNGGRSYVSRGRAVIIQRTANRDQRRRLNASAVTAAFAMEHAEHGYVAENHVIVCEPQSDNPRVSPEMLAAVLNSAVASARFSAVAGSFSVSAKLLARMALPEPAQLPPLGPGFDEALATAFAALDGILANQVVADPAAATNIAEAA